MTVVKTWLKNCLNGRLGPSDGMFSFENSRTRSKLNGGLQWKIRDHDGLLGLSAKAFLDVKFVAIRSADSAMGVVGHVQ